MILNELNKLTPEEQEELIEKKLERMKNVPVFTAETMESNAFVKNEDEEW